jgi:hypothetical protein
MKILNLIIASTNESHYISLIDEWKRYMNINPNISSYFIRLDNEACGENDYLIDELSHTIFIKGTDGYIPEIYDKTSLALKIILGLPTYKEIVFVVRTNLSTFWIWNNLMHYLNDKPTHSFISGVLGNHDRNRFPGGCGMVMSRDVAQLWADNYDYPKKRQLYDDVAMGDLLAEKHIPIVEVQRFDIEAHHSFPSVIDTIKQLGQSIYHVRNKIYWDFGGRISGLEAKNYSMLIDAFY